jgi:hypothetical protein
VTVELSVVVPVCNEAENVAPLAREIATALQGREFEMLFVDDGSTDATLQVLQQLRRDGLTTLRILRHAFRSGQSAAVAVKGDPDYTGYRDARVWLPLGWVLLLLQFFSLTPGKRSIYMDPALPAVALAATPFLAALHERRSVQRLGVALSGLLIIGAAVFAGAHLAGAHFARKAIQDANLDSAWPLYLFLALSLAGLGAALWRKPIAAWLAGAPGRVLMVPKTFLEPCFGGSTSRQAVGDSAGDDWFLVRGPATPPAHPGVTPIAR